MVSQMNQRNIYIYIYKRIILHPSLLLDHRILDLLCLFLEIKTIGTAKPR